MTTIVTIAQQKGGAGKTSLAAHLATFWAHEQPSGDTDDKPAKAAMRRVTLVDLDPQQSLTAWFRLRQELHGDDQNIVLRPAAGWRMATEVAKAREESDLIVIDSPPHAETATRVGIRSADLVVVPLQLSPMDIWAAKPTLDMIAHEKRPALVVFNRVPARARAASAIAEALKRERLPIANASLGNRIAYTSSLMSGRGVTESDPRSRAATEIRELALEIMGHLH